MTPHEERLVLELHAKWGNRWSRIARRLPGRTDNEIKNYWRTHMRKKAQERKQAMSPSSSSSNCCSLSPNNMTMGDSLPFFETGEPSFYDTGGGHNVLPSEGKMNEQDACDEQGYPMDEIWKEIAQSGDEPIKPVCGGTTYEGRSFAGPPMASPMWEYSPDTLLRMDDEESKMFNPICHQFSGYEEHDEMSLTG